jgi:hypothetical protein
MKKFIMMLNNCTQILKIYLLLSLLIFTSCFFNRINTTMKKVVLFIVPILLLCNCRRYLNYTDFDWTYQVNKDYKNTAFFSSDTLVFGCYGKEVKCFSIKKGQFIAANANEFDTRLAYDLKTYPENKYVNYIGNIYGEMTRQGILKKSYAFPLLGNTYLDKLQLIHRDDNLNRHADSQKYLKMKRKHHFFSRKFHLKEWTDINIIQNIYLSDTNMMVIYFDKISEDLNDPSYIGLLDLKKMYKKLYYLR